MNLHFSSIHLLSGITTLSWYILSFINYFTLFMSHSCSLSIIDHLSFFFIKISSFPSHIAQQDVDYVGINIYFKITFIGIVSFYHYSQIIYRDVDSCLVIFLCSNSVGCSFNRNEINTGPIYVLNLETFLSPWIFKHSNITCWR